MPAWQRAGELQRGRLIDSPGNCAGKPGLRHHSEPFRLRLGQLGIGRNHRQRGVLAWSPFAPERQCIGGECRWPTAPAELLVLFERCGPEMWTVSDRHAPGGVCDDQRTNGEPAACPRAGRPDAALKIDGGRSETSAGTAKGEIVARQPRRLIAELAV